MAVALLKLLENTTSQLTSHSSGSSSLSTLFSEMTPKLYVFRDCVRYVYYLGLCIIMSHYLRFEQLCFWVMVSAC